VFDFVDAQEMKIMHMLGNHPNVLKLHAASFAGPAGSSCGMHEGSAWYACCEACCPAAHVHDW
jgi:hypothetical protein